MAKQRPKRPCRRCRELERIVEQFRRRLDDLNAQSIRLDRLARMRRGEL